jgi:hypothetical protein
MQANLLGIGPEIIAEQAAEHLRQIRRLDEVEAEKSLENCLDVLFEGGVLSMWRYRIVLAKIREGL